MSEVKTNERDFVLDDSCRKIIMLMNQLVIQYRFSQAEIEAQMRKIQDEMIANVTTKNS
jgi:hypothetical protein